MDQIGRERKGWKRQVALLVACASTLAALVALRGPDLITAGTAQATGSWLLSGPSAWHPQTLFGAASNPSYALAGPRGWQNLHVGAAWLAIVCWLFPLASTAWRGLAPLIPALLAATLSVPASGMSGFGLSVLALSAWRLMTYGRATSAASFPVAAWMAAWLSPGALPVVVAFAVESCGRWTRARLGVAAAAALLLMNATPHGFAVWREAWIFLCWTPSAAPDAAAVIALLLNVAALALALRWALGRGCVGVALAPALLLLAAAQGQAAYLWASALMSIPLWTPAKEQLRRLGIKVRWWAATALLVTAALLAIWRGAERVNDWYNLAMVRDVAQPTLTRDALPRGVEVYINPQGRALARLSGRWPARAREDETPGLARQPRLWRVQDRKMRYRAVWLLGDKADYAPLARHLGESPDWRLAAVDAAGLLFLRGARESQFATEPAQERARNMVGAANRSRFLADSALAALAAQALPEAGELSQSSVRKSDLASLVASARALVLVSTGQIDDALAQSARAVALTPSLSEAWQARAEALLHAGRADDAYAAAQRAAELAPGDEGALWLAARAANAARAFQSEAEILERLVALTAGRGGDAGFYQLYLGQSYAKQGLARPALRSLEQAAVAPGLSEEQRADLREEIARVRESAGSE